jgi:hypothetical protein
MLHEFLSANRDELIARCKDKAALRFGPAKTPAIVSSGVPIFLQQLVDTLRQEEKTSSRESGGVVAAPADSAIGHSAALHGADMLRQGFTVDQVVHDYGDVCQSVTDMAVEQRRVISVDEFRTLNRCLDEAIADAVTSFGDIRNRIAIDRAEDLHQQLDYFIVEQRRLIALAIHSYTAIKTGDIGSGGATGTLLVRALEDLRILTDQIVPELRLATAKAAIATPDLGRAGS